MRTDSLLREIVIVLLLKTIALTALWHVFFSQPDARSVDAEQVSRVVFESGASQAITTPSREPHHDH